MPWYLSPCQNLASNWLPLVQLIYLFIFINRNIRSLFLPDAANPLMNMPVKMKMKAPVNYLLQHSARQINSNKKREVITAGSTCQCVDLRGCLQGSMDKKWNWNVLQDLIIPLWWTYLRKCYIAKIKFNKTVKLQKHPPEQQLVVWPVHVTLWQLVTQDMIVVMVSI